MEKIKAFISDNKKIVIPVLILIIIIAAAAVCFAVFGLNNKKSDNLKTQGNASVQEVEAEDIAPLAEKGIISGIKDVTVVKGTKTDFEDLIAFADDYVESVYADDTNIDFSKEGEYNLIYTVTFNGQNLRKLLKDEGIEAGFDTSGDKIIINIPVKVSVADEETADKEAGSGDEIKTEENDDKAGENNGDKTSSNDNVNITDNNSDAANAGSDRENTGKEDLSGSGTECKHVWVTRTETVQEPVTVIVDHEQREYSLYRFYWYNTGTWEETRDGSRFQEWYRSADGGLYPLYNPYERPEDNPLFIEYDSNGNPTYQNDHTIVSGLFENVPCEPYEKTEMTTVTKTVTKCSLCGAVK